MPITPTEFAYDVFISYSHRDKTWVCDELLPRLEDAGLKVCIDYRDFRVGAPIVKEMERAVLTSRHTLLVLTPDYLESAWADFEALMISTLDPGSQKERLLPLLLRPCDPPLHIKYLGHADFTTPDDLALSWRRLFEGLGVPGDPGRQADMARPAQRAIFDVGLERYDLQIIKQYGEIRIFGQITPKSLKEIFTEVYVLDQPTALRRFAPETVREHLWNKDRGKPRRAEERLPAEDVLSRTPAGKFFILGRPGAGKTTFLKRLAVREAQHGVWGPCLGKTPIFVSLKQYVETKKPLLDYIVNQFLVCQFPDAALTVEQLLHSGQALVLFDGLDEVTKSATAADDPRGQVTEEIERFARQYDDCHVVVTCRIAATEYTFPPLFVYLEMADFAPEQVDDFVRGWFWNPKAPDGSAALAEKMLAEWRQPEHVGIRDLGRNPLLLTLLCLNYAETLRFASRRAEIYDEALQALLKKWDVSRQIQRASAYKSLSVGRKQQMFARIAYDGFFQNEILFGQKDLEAQLVAYLARVPGMPESIDIDGNLVLREIIEQHGLFLEQSRGLFSFAHLTFQEYYAAKYIAENASSDVIDALLARMTDDKWRQVFTLTAEMLPDATQFLTAFQVVLQRLAASRSQLAGWLLWIDEQAGMSQAGYSRPATRLFYASACIFNSVRVDDFSNFCIGDFSDFCRAMDSSVFANAFGRLIERSVDLANAFAAFDYASPLYGDLGRDCALANALARLHRRDSYFALAVARARAGISKNISDSAFVFAPVRKRILELCQQQGRTVLCAAVSALEVPATEASDEAWRSYASRLAQVIEAQGDLARYRHLEAEVASAKEQGKQWMLDHEDVETLTAYANASRLFYDCLQVAPVVDQCGFEERFLEVQG